MSRYMILATDQPGDRDLSLDAMIEGEDDIDMLWMRRFEGGALHVVNAPGEASVRRLADRAREEFGGRMELWEQIEREESQSERQVRASLEQTFPASDPPSFTP